MVCNDLFGLCHGFIYDDSTGFHGNHPWCTTIDHFHKSQNSLVSYPRKLHSHFCSERSVLGYGTGAFWDLWIRSIVTTSGCRHDSLRRMKTSWYWSIFGITGYLWGESLVIPLTNGQWSEALIVAWISAWTKCWRNSMMTSSNGNIFRVTGRLWGNSPVTGALMFSLICAWINAWVNNREAGDSKRYCVHYDVTVMSRGRLIKIFWRPIDVTVMLPWFQYIFNSE